MAAQPRVPRPLVSLCAVFVLVSGLVAGCAPSPSEPDDAADLILTGGVIWTADDERPGPRCYCGQYGCLETFLSGPGLARDFAAAGGPPLTAHEIVSMAV